jgi:serine/threonine-protein kinase
MQPRVALSLVLTLAACGNESLPTPDASTRSDGGAGASDGGGGATRDGSAGASDGGAATHDGGVGASDGGAGTGDASTTSSARYFPEGSFIYQRVDQAPLDPDSRTITDWLQGAGGFGTGEMRIDFSIEVLTATPTTPRRTFTRTDDFYTPDCDPAPFPVPAGGALEGESGYACTGDGDCHLIVVDRPNGRLYEMWRANIVGDTFYGGCSAIWDMRRAYGSEGRGEQCTSADAAGFPIAPLLFSADEVAAGSIDHAIRFILPNARMRDDTYQHPGTHAGGPSGPASAPIYGSRFRLRADFDLASLPSEGARVVARALQRYGMVLADGGNIALTAQSDRFSTRKWSDLLDTRDLRSIQPRDFEVVQTGEPIALTFDCQRVPITD